MEEAAPVRTPEIVAAEIREEKRLHDRQPAHFKHTRDAHMANIHRLLDEHLLLSRGDL